MGEYYVIIFLIMSKRELFGRYHVEKKNPHPIITSFFNVYIFKSS
jgi:hypothetical protein